MHSSNRLLLLCSPGLADKGHPYCTETDDLQITIGKKRPVFTAVAPAPYRTLAEHCWDEDVDKRCAGGG